MLEFPLYQVRRTCETRRKRFCGVVLSVAGYYGARRRTVSSKILELKRIVNPYLHSSQIKVILYIGTPRLGESPLWSNGYSAETLANNDFAIQYETG